MIFRWLGIATLAVSWLLSLGVYHDSAGWAMSLIPIVVGSLLLAGSGRRSPPWPCSVAAVVLLIPALFVLTMPHLIGLVVLTLGLVLSLLPEPRRLWQRLGSGTIIAGVKPELIQPNTLVEPASHARATLATPLALFDRYEVSHLELLDLWSYLNDLA